MLRNFGRQISLEGIYKQIAMPLISISRELIQQGKILTILKTAGYELTELRQEEPSVHRFNITGGRIPDSAVRVDIEVFTSKPEKWDDYVAWGPDEYYIRVYWKES